VVARSRSALGSTVGDIIIDGDDIFGDGVNLAARVLRIALPQANGMDCGRQHLGLVLVAVGRDLRGILLQGVVVQHVAVASGIVITTHPKADEISLVWTGSEPTTARDLIHIDADLSFAWLLRTGYQQSRRY
jgi:hypothetical protein